MHRCHTAQTSALQSRFKGIHTTQLFDGTSSSEENSNMRQKLHLTGLKCTDISVVNENVVNYSVVIKSVVNEGVVNYSVVNGIQFQ